MGLVLVIGGSRGVRQQCECRAERYCVGLLLLNGGSRWGETALRGTEWNVIVWDWYWLLWAGGGVTQQCEGRAERYCVGLVLLIGGSRWGEAALRVRVGNGIVWDWYWLLGSAGGVREQ